MTFELPSRLGITLKYCETLCQSGAATLVESNEAFAALEYEIRLALGLLPKRTKRPGVRRPSELDPVDAMEARVATAVRELGGRATANEVARHLKVHATTAGPSLNGAAKVGLLVRTPARRGFVYEATPPNHSPSAVSSEEGRDA